MAADLHDRIHQRLDALGKNPQQASLDAGLSRDYLRTLLNRPHSVPRGNALAALAEALDTTPDWLLGMDMVSGRAGRKRPPAPMSAADLPVFGLAAGSVLGALTMGTEPVEYVPCPPGLSRVKGAYALIVTGSSMEPRYMAGDMIFLHPHRPPRPGDHVVIQEISDGTKTWIKRFERQTETHLVTLQYNPPAEVKFARNTITAVHRVLTTNELFGI